MMEMIILYLYHIQIRFADSGDAPAAQEVPKNADPLEHATEHYVDENTQPEIPEGAPEKE